MGVKYGAFEVLYYKVESVSSMDYSEATVKVMIGEKTEHRVAEGNGPVNALDNAIRKALLPHFPVLESVKLTDFWVRVNNGDAGTGASVEVMIISSDKTNKWTTTAVSTDVIKASAEALIKSFKEALFSKRVPVLDH